MYFRRAQNILLWGTKCTFVVINISYSFYGQRLWTIGCLHQLQRDHKSAEDCEKNCKVLQSRALWDASLYGVVSLIKDLNKCVKYEKAEKFFSKGLHSYFERNGGSLKKAIANAEKSMKEKEKNDRDYTYSELGQLMKALGGFTK